MAKKADRYYREDPWMVVEDGFDNSYSMVSESIFSLGNEHMGVRGYFDEGYSGDRLMGSYLNGVYEQSLLPKSGYKGVIDKTDFMVNTVDWLYTRITLDGETLDLAISTFREFKRVLNLKTGQLTRSFVWVTAQGKETELHFERFLSMNDTQFGGQRVTAKALNYDGTLTIKAGLDFSQPHVTAGDNLWQCTESAFEGCTCRIAAQTKTSKQKVFSCCRFEGDFTEIEPVDDGPKKSAVTFALLLHKGKKSSFNRLAANISFKANEENTKTACLSTLAALKENSYDALVIHSENWWEQTWKHSDIEINGDDLNQQGIRFCIFQMHQTYHGAQPGTVIGAKGLTGEAYNGNTFWDTETYCLPFYIFNNPEAARNLLMFRYQTLPQAKMRANALDCEGAFYPVATIGGDECCSLWQHSSLQLQASTAVAYGIWHYVKLTADYDFLYNYGAEMLVEICRMLATRGDYSSENGKYGYYGVMGPDEFQMMVHNNCYTNYMGKATFEYTLEVLLKLRESSPKQYEKLCSASGLNSAECQKWHEMADAMDIPYETETELFEQHRGFFSLPHIDVDKIPVTDFPLYSHWTYDRIYRNDMIKQPDVLMLMLLYNARFTKEQKQKNYEYYEPKCIHESSLSPSVHSILACELAKYDEAYRFFGFATRMDLDNYNRNSSEGLHTTAIAAAWMNIVYGFGGMRSDGDTLSFSPMIPERWQSYCFRVIYHNTVLTIQVNTENVALSIADGETATIAVYAKEITLAAGKTAFVALKKTQTECAGKHTN